MSLVSQWYVLFVLGPGRATDALFASMMVPQLVLAISSAPLANVLISVLAVENPAHLQRTNWTLVQLGAIGFGSLAFALFLTAGVWVPVIVPGFERSAQVLTINLIHVQLPAMVLAGIAGVLWSIHQARHRFARVEATNASTAAAALGFLIWQLPTSGVEAAAWAAVLKAGLDVIFLLPGMGRYLAPDWHGASLREVWRRVRPLMAGAAYLKSDRLTDRFFASAAPAGGLSLLHLGQQLYSAGHVILAKVFSTPAIPGMAHLAAESDWDGFHRLVDRQLRIMLSIACAVFLGLALLGWPLMEFGLARGGFGAGEVRLFWWILIALAGVWIGGAAGVVLAQAFYSRGETTLPMRIAVVGFAIGIIFKLVGLRWFGVLGIAAGASAHYLINAALLHLFLWRHRRETGNLVYAGNSAP